MAVLAEAGRYPFAVAATKQLCTFWNGLVEMEDARLAKACFRAAASAVLGPLTRSNSNHKSGAGQVASLFTSLGLPCDLNTTALWMSLLLASNCRASTSSRCGRSRALKCSNTCVWVQHWIGIATPQQYICWSLAVEAAQAPGSAVGTAQAPGSHWLAVETRQLWARESHPAGAAM